MNYSFWQLIADNKIEIPIIQRDYAQGRIEEFSIADKFITKIKSKLTSGNRLNLDFVYGKNQNDTIIPLDGQQRLTTLFLLHWYLAVKDEAYTDDVKSKLSKFTYETRISSQDFCKYLVNKSIPKINIGEKLSKQIKNENWFFTTWENDPTISAMLNMLDIIHNNFKSETSSFFENLQGSGSLITFNYLPLNQFKLSDELYIKMNSRGKPLTDFENFKSVFSSFLEFGDKSKLDNDWYDVFWNFEKDEAKPDTSRIDARFFNFFENLAVNFLAEENDIDRKTLDEFNLLDHYKTVFFLDSKYIYQTKKCLNALFNFDDVSGYFSKATERKITYVERLKLYSVTTFFIKCGSVTELNKIQFFNWMRICKNLINNTLIQSVDQYLLALRAIKILSKGIEDVYNHIIDMNILSGFLEVQQNEEKIKADLILNKDEDWKKIIYKIENNSYFDGQIGFILNYSKNDFGYDIKKFENYAIKLDFLFDQLKESQNYLFQRALFSIDDYLVDIRSSKTFCTFENNLRSKMDTWRKVFNESSKSQILKELLDRIGSEDISADLLRIIDSCSYTNWKLFFVSEPQVLERCLNNQIRIDNDRIWLARSKADNWQYRGELFTFVFSLKCFKENSHQPFLTKKYFDSAYEEPCAYLLDFKTENGNHFEIDVFFNNGFDFCLYDKNKKDTEKTLGNNFSEFTYDEEKQKFLLHTEIENIDLANEKLLEICSKLI